MRALSAAVMLGLLAHPAVAQAGKCYDSDLGSWMPVETAQEVRQMPLPSEMGDSLSYSFPPRIRVDSGGTFSIPTGALPTVHHTMEWRMSDGAMHFFLDWQRGYVGLVGSLEPTEFGWEGYGGPIWRL